MSYRCDTCQIDFRTLSSLKVHLELASSASTSSRSHIWTVEKPYQSRIREALGDPEDRIKGVSV